jgi:hypothetical protein
VLRFYGHSLRGRLGGFADARVEVEVQSAPLAISASVFVSDATLTTDYDILVSRH